MVCLIFFTETTQYMRYIIFISLGSALNHLCKWIYKRLDNSKLARNNGRISSKTNRRACALYMKQWIYNWFSQNKKECNYVATWRGIRRGRNLWRGESIPYLQKPNSSQTCNSGCSYNATHNVAILKLEAVKIIWKL